MKATIVASFDPIYVLDVAFDSWIFVILSISDGKFGNRLCYAECRQGYNATLNFKKYFFHFVFPPNQTFAWGKLYFSSIIFFRINSSIDAGVCGDQNQ